VLLELAVRPSTAVTCTGTVESANVCVIVERAAVGRGSRTVVRCILITRRTDGGWMRVWDEREMHDARWTEFGATTVQHAHGKREASVVLS
jgi:hypothetical protein